jgi:hypothetical protein
MPLPTLNDVHIDKPLTNLSVSLIQDTDKFVFNKVFPSVPVQERSGIYYKYNEGDFMRDQAQKRAPGTESAGNGFNYNTDTYTCEEWAFHHDVPDEIIANADAVLRPRREANELVMHTLMIRQEKQFVNTYMTGGVWGYDIDGVASSPGANEVIQWDDYENSNPITDVQDARRNIMLKTGREPNVMVLGRPVYDALVNHPDLIDRLDRGQTPGSPAMVTRQALAALFEVDRVEVMDAVVNEADQGQADSKDFIGGKTALLVHAPSSPGVMKASAGYVFRWDFLGGGNNGIVTRSFRMDALKSERIEGNIFTDMKLVSADLGAFWDTIVS